MIGAQFVLHRVIGSTAPGYGPAIAIGKESHLKIVRAWEEKGVEIPAPFQRQIKVLFAPDKEGVEEITFSHAILPPNGRTDYHSHDRPELIYIVSGRGICVHEGEETQVQEDVALWVPAGERHQMINSGDVPLKLATVFVPAYTASSNYRRCLIAAEAAASKR
jgi:mannose-6-phosphate isomerase-like protein (cupin superfamily)